MRKFSIIIMIMSLLLIPILLSARVTYLTDGEYKKLSSSEREQYCNDLNAEMIALQGRKTSAIENQGNLDKEIAVLQSRIESVNQEITALTEKLGISEKNIADFRTRITNIKNDLTNWEKMSDSQFWEKQKEFIELNETINNEGKNRLAQLPEFKRDFSDIHRRYNAIKESMNKISSSDKPAYYEDNYQVKKGDYLSKISAYSFIYGDSNKWGIIYRANRDQIKDPNVISDGMDLKIPRGLPGSWKVYSGESLWKISAYPEVYGKGSKWTHIYRANKDQIKDPNLIYPEQIFSIPRD